MAEEVCVRVQVASLAGLATHQHDRPSARARPLCQRVACARRNAVSENTCHLAEPIARREAKAPPVGPARRAEISGRRLLHNGGGEGWVPNSPRSDRLTAIAASYAGVSPCSAIARGRYTLLGTACTTRKAQELSHVCHEERLLNICVPRGGRLTLHLCHSRIAAT